MSIVALGDIIIRLEQDESGYFSLASDAGYKPGSPGYAELERVMVALRSLQSDEDRETTRFFERRENDRVSRQ